MKTDQHHTLFAGIEAGGTKFNCVIGTAPDDVWVSDRIPTTTPDETLVKVNNFFNNACRQYGAFKALGLACFGPLDLDQNSDSYGHITTTVKKYWSDTNIVGILSKALAIPVAFDTDVNGAAIAEHRYGAAKNIDNFIYVTVGTGIGAGVVINGRLVRGPSNIGPGHPEIGHILVPKDHQLDSYEGCCKFHTNCVESLASGTAIKARWGKAGDALPKDNPAWDLEAYYLAAMCINLTMCYSPQKIVFGGGVMEQKHLFKKIHQHFIALAGGYFPKLSQHNLIDYIVPTSLGGRAGEYGALALAQDKFNEGSEK